MMLSFLLVQSALAACQPQVGDELLRHGYAHWRQHHPLVATTAPVPLAGDQNALMPPDGYMAADKLATAGMITFLAGSGAATLGVFVVLAGTVEMINGVDDGMILVGGTMILLGGVITSVVGEGLMLGGSLQAGLILRQAGAGVEVWPGWLSVGLVGGGLALELVVIPLTISASTSNDPGAATAVSAIGSLPGLLSTAGLVFAFTQYHISHHAGAMWRPIASRPGVLLVPMAAPTAQGPVFGLAGSW